ncbi:MAG: hypothetical protein AB1486_27255 [Planctomycetota bacterium]
MKRPARLQSARHWLAGYHGKHIVKSYARWFRVDFGCALNELQMLGVSLDPVYVERVKTTLRERSRQGEARRVERQRLAAVQERYEEELRSFEELESISGVIELDEVLRFHEMIQREEELDVEERPVEPDDEMGERDDAEVEEPPVDAGAFDDEVSWDELCRRVDSEGDRNLPF